MAGLGLKMLVKEPTAAAIAYNEDKKLEDSNIMIFDFGGGKYIIIIWEQRIEVVSMNPGTLDINIAKLKMKNSLYKQFMEMST